MTATTSKRIYRDLEVEHRRVLNRGGNSAVPG
jgi:hypothetical protein